MIGKDAVSISLATSPEYYLWIGDNGDIIVKKQQGGMPFSFLKNSLLAEGAFLDDGGVGQSKLKKVATGLGEEWELVK